ncbi:MAG: hypothetical protein WBA16_05980 [Nonlabens sp.]
MAVLKNSDRAINKSRIFYAIIIVLLVATSCTYEDENEGVIRIELGQLDSLRLERYQSSTIGLNDYQLIDEYNLEPQSNALVIEQMKRGGIGISSIYNCDSIAIILNGDRRLTSQVFRDPSPLFFEEFYQNPGGDIYIKTFTQEDYENADPF